MTCRRRSAAYNQLRSKRRKQIKGMASFHAMVNARDLGAQKKTPWKNEDKDPKRDKQLKTRNPGKKKYSKFYIPEGGGAGKGLGKMEGVSAT